jgi:hypothetical protein
MNRPGFWLHLSNIDAGTWRATFSRESTIAADGFGTGETPRLAVQHAARDALAKLESGEATPRDWTETDDAPA